MYIIYICPYKYMVKKFECKGILGQKHPKYVIK